jgi:cobalt-zinc-cadmium efflux system outer membrane protein
MGTMRLWFICLLFVLVPTAIGAEENARYALTLEQAIINVLEHNPELKAAEYEAKVAAARIRSAQLSRPFRTLLEFENFGGSGRNSGSDSLESTLSLSKVLELGNKARLRGEVAQNRAMVLNNTHDARRLDLLAETAKRFIHVITDQERLVIAKDSLVLAKRTQKFVEQRVQAGKSPSAELRWAKIVTARKSLELEHAEHELATSRLKLVTLWGETQVPFTAAQADLFAIEQVTPFESLAQMLEQNPDLVRFATKKRLADARIQLASAKRSPDIEIAGGVRHFNDTDDTGLVLSLNMPLGSASRAAPKIEEAEMLNLRNPYTYEQRKLEMHATLFAVYQEISHAVDAVKTLRETIIPQAEYAVQDYEKGYAAGRYSFLELTVAQRALLDSRREFVMAAEDYHRFRTEIDRLTGAGLSAGVNP